MNRIISGLLIYVLAITQVFAQAALVPNAKQTFLGTTGAPLASGQVFMYVPGSTNKKTTWVDPNQASNNTNPIALDAAGRAIIWGQGSYRQVVKDKNGNTIWDAVTNSPGAASPTGATGTDTAPVGSVMPYTGFSVPTNWQLAYGQAVSRTTYSDLKTAITIVDTTVSCTSGSTTLSGFVSTDQMRVGAPIEATCISTGITIATIASPTSITISSAASATGTVTATVFPWGNGDGVSTFNIPDLRGRVFAGADAMGGTAASRLTSTYYGASASPPGVAGGAQSRTIAQNQLPNVSPALAASFSGTFTGTQQTWSFNGNQALQSNGVQGSSGGSGLLGAALVQSVTVTPSGTIAGTVTGTVAINGGVTQQALATIQPSITINYMIKMAPNSTGAGGVVSIGGMFGDIVCAASFVCAPVGSPSVNTIGCTISTTSQLGCMYPDGTTTTVDGTGKLSSIAAIASQINVGVTTVSGGTNPYILYNNAGVLGNLPITGTAGNVVLSIAPTITGHPTIEGVKSTGATGTGALVFSNTPSFATPILGAPTATTLAIGGCTLGGTALCATGHVLFEGVTSTGATGTGNLVFATSPSVSGLSVTGSFTATGLVDNASLVHPSTTVNGQTCTLGSTCTVTAAATGVTVGTTTVSSGTSTRILYDNAGVLGEYTLSGSGTAVAMATSPVLTTPTLGVATGTSLALGGATIGANALAVTGHLLLEGVTSTGATGTGALVFGTAPSVSSLTVTTAFTATGLVTNADLANPATTVNGQTCTLGSTCTVAAEAGTLTGTTLASNVVTSSLTTVGTIGTGLWQGTAVALGFGGSGKTTALAARSSTGFNIDGLTSTGDANYTILSTDRMVYHTALSAPRTDTLPAANAVNAGQQFVISDFAGVAGATNTITLQRAGSDTINGGNTVVAVNSQYGAGIFWSDGSSRWTFEPTSSGGGGGTVTSLTPGAGLVSSVSASCSQSAITTSGTISQAECVNAQTGTSYSIVNGDRAKLVTASNAAAQAYSIAQAGNSSAFQAGWYVDVRNVSTNAAGIVTITPTTSTIDGAATLVLNPGRSARITSDGTNYQVSLTGGKQTLPTVQTFTSGSGTYTTPTGVLWIEVRMVGGGGSGSGSGTTSPNGSAGGDTTWSTMLAKGGGGATGLTAGTGVAPSGLLGNVILAQAGASGQAAVFGSVLHGGDGGQSCLGGRGPGGGLSSPGGAAVANSGSGSGGAGATFGNATTSGGGGGAAGACIISIFNTPAATYSYAVGVAGTTASAGTSGQVGGVAAAGYLVVIEHYNN